MMNLLFLRPIQSKFNRVNLLVFDHFKIFNSRVLIKKILEISNNNRKLKILLFIFILFDIN